MSDRVQAGGHKYDARACYAGASSASRTWPACWPEDEFRTQSRARLQEKLLEVSKQAYPATVEEQIDSRLARRSAATETRRGGGRRELPNGPGPS